MDYRFGSTEYMLAFSREEPKTGFRDILHAGPDTYLELADDNVPHVIAVVLPQKPKEPA
ncbi:hypothetical protein D3C76_1479950 [compost metagenome]